MRSAAVGVAPQVGAAPDPTRMRATVARLAADDFTGRRVGTAGGRAAAGWLADTLRESGADVELNEFPVVGAVREVYATPELTFRHDGQTERFVFRRDFCEHLASADVPQTVSGRLAFADDADPGGAWVLHPRFTAEQVADAGKAGALGVLVPRGTDGAGWMPKMIAGPATTGLPVLAVRADVHDRMLAAVGAGMVSGSAPLRTAAVTGANVVATFRPPSGEGLSVLLTAHYDGVGDDPDDVRFPAACDNASGVAAVIEAARVLDAMLPADVGLAVALVDAEEAGAFGSAHHAAQVPAGTVVINLDGAAQLADAAHVEAGGPAQTLLAALDAAGREIGVPLQAAEMPSDNRRFAAAGLASVGIGMGMPGYQTPAEAPGRVEDATLLAAANLVVATVVHLAQDSA